jgi:hypothetical protein
VFSGVFERTSQSIRLHGRIKGYSESNNILMKNISAKNRGLAFFMASSTSVRLFPFPKRRRTPPKPPEIPSKNRFCEYIEFSKTLTVVPLIPKKENMIVDKKVVTWPKNTQRVLFSPRENARDIPSNIAWGCNEHQ